MAFSRPVHHRECTRLQRRAQLPRFIACAASPLHHHHRRRLRQSRQQLQQPRAPLRKLIIRFRRIQRQPQIDNRNVNRQLLNHPRRFAPRLRPMAHDAHRLQQSRQPIDPRISFPPRVAQQQVQPSTHAATSAARACRPSRQCIFRMAAQHHHAPQSATRVPVPPGSAAPPERLSSKDLQQTSPVHAPQIPPWHTTHPTPSANLAACKSLPPTFG